MQKKIIIWHNHLCRIGGVETWLVNTCIALREYYDILVLCISGDWKQISRLKQYVKVEKLDKEKIYKADIVIRNSVWSSKLPENIVSTKNRIIEMKHANYVYLRDSGRLKDQYIPDDRVTEYLACGEFVAKMYEEYSGTKIPFIRNILAPKVKTEKIYRFVSTSRVYDPDKGWNETMQFCSMMKKTKLKFEMIIFSDLPDWITPEMIPYKEIHVYEPRLDIFDYVADADYVFLFTRSEGCPYSIQEALQYGTPCIVSDVGGCTELIQDGVNGYVVKDLNTFDINKIKKIPKFEPYIGTTAQDWCDYLGGAKYKKKPLYESGKIKVRAIDHYTDMSYPTDDGFIQKDITPGDEYEVDEDRAKELVNGQYAEYTGGL